MATNNLQFPEIATSQASPEVTHNDALQAIDDNLTKYLDVDCSAGGTISVTAANFRAQRVLRLTGSPAGSFTLEVPLVQREFAVLNESGQQATVQQTSTPGNTVTVANTVYSVLYATAGTSKDIFKAA